MQCLEVCYIGFQIFSLQASLPDLAMTQTWFTSDLNQIVKLLDHEMVRINIFRSRLSRELNRIHSLIARVLGS